MNSIKISKQKNTSLGWEFEVAVYELNYKVSLAESYWQELTEEKITPEELIKNSFQFLLEREPKESILKKFDLKVISDYFPEYEEEIKESFK